MKLMSTMLSQCILSWNLVFPVRSIYIFCYKRNLYSVQKTNMKTLVIICLMVSVFTFSEACSCIGGHPQRQFCDADFGRYLIVFLCFFFGFFGGFFVVYLWLHTNKIFDRSMKYHIFVVEVLVEIEIIILAANQIY